jgi:hypothetical protein
MALTIVKRIFAQVAKEAPTGPYFGTIINAKESGEEIGIYVEQEDENFIFSFYVFSGFIPEKEIENILVEGTTKWVEQNNLSFQKFEGNSNCFYLGSDEPLDDLFTGLFDDLVPGSPEWEEEHKKIVNKIISFLFD